MIPLETCVIQVEMEEFPIFISYSRRDIEQVKLIRASIEEATKVRCWMDLKAIESGSKRFTKDIITGINNCQVFLFMLTENSQHSEFALRELDFADKKGKKVVIVNVNNCVMCDEFQFLYGLTDTILWTDTLQQEKLLRDLKRWIVDGEPTSAQIQQESEKETLQQNDKTVRSNASMITLSLILGMVSIGIIFCAIDDLNRYFEGLPLVFFSDIVDLIILGANGIAFNIGGLILNYIGTKRAKKNKAVYKPLSTTLILGRILNIVAVSLWVVKLFIYLFKYA